MGRHDIIKKTEISKQTSYFQQKSKPRVIDNNG